MKACAAAAAALWRRVCGVQQHRTSQSHGGILLPSHPFHFLCLLLAFYGSLPLTTLLNYAIKYAATATAAAACCDRTNTPAKRTRSKKASRRRCRDRWRRRRRRSTHLFQLARSHSHNHHSRCAVLPSLSLAPLLRADRSIESRHPTNTTTLAPWMCVCVCVARVVSEKQ